MCPAIRQGNRPHLRFQRLPEEPRLRTDHRRVELPGQHLAIDALGNIYVIEDAPNGSSTGGDIWFIRDTNNDGVAESIDHFLSIRVAGSEATGMIFNPAVPTEFVVACQHPNSTNLEVVPDGLGDAVWSFNVSNIDNQKFVKTINKGEAFTNQ